MAEDKKPKIDLKARLGKSSTAQAPAAGLGGAPAPSSGRSAPTPVPPATGGVVPVPPGVPVGPPSPFGVAPPKHHGAIDPSNPLAAVAAPYRAPPPQATMVQPQRIEVDEVAVHEARKGARRQGVIIGLVMAVVFAAVGYVAGGASEKSGAREKSKGDAKDLADKLAETKKTLVALADKMEAGKSSLTGRKFPAELSKELGGINVDFDGGQLSGRRFSGFSTQTTQGLIDFVTSVQALNDRKLLVQGLLNRLQKPMTEQFTGTGLQSISLMVVADRNGSAMLASLKDTIPVPDPKNITLPKEFVFTAGGQNSKIDPYKGGDLSKAPAGFYVLPGSFNQVCPSETQGQAAQLGAQLAGVIREIKGEGPAAKGEEIVQDTKAGLLERADKLIEGLKRVE